MRQKKTKKVVDEQKAMVTRFSDVMAGRVMPTLPEYFALCISAGAIDHNGLKKRYPKVYKTLKSEYNRAQKVFETRFKQKPLRQTSVFADRLPVVKSTHVHRTHPNQRSDPRNAN